MTINDKVKKMPEPEPEPEPQMQTSPCAECGKPVEHDGLEEDEVICMSCAYLELEPGQICKHDMNSEDCMACAKERFKG